MEGYLKFTRRVTLYLCPQSEIFHNSCRLSKGMTAVRGISASFIGCVVWRKNQTTAGYVANEKSSQHSTVKQSKKIPSNSSTTQSGETETSMSTGQPVQTPISAMPLSAVNDTVPIGSSSGANLLKTPLVPSGRPIQLWNKGLDILICLHMHPRGSLWKGKLFLLVFLHPSTYN